QTAVILDPENSLYRSYLGKAYFEERRKDAAEKELEIAKQLDPSDPTPYLYGALVKRTYNRPVEALKDLQKSIELNDKRAVYRSRLLLDEDLAVRSADLAGTYNDLGFDQLGMVTARRSADIDQSNHSAHLFLAGTYRRLPGFAPAFLSETLQARIYQPVNVNAVRPDVVNESVSFNEYTSLINRNRVRGFATIGYGEVDTDLENSALAPLEIGDSNPSGGEATVSFNRDRLAGALSYESFEDDGFRINNDVDNKALRGFLAFAPSYRDQFQLSFIDGTRETGDLPLRAVPFIPGIERIETELTNVGLGYHRIISPAADLAVSLIYNDTRQTAVNRFDGQPTGSAQLEGPQIEAQYVRRQTWLTWTAGVGHFDGEQTADTVVLGQPTSASADDEFSNGYLYAKLRKLGPVELTAGASYEEVTAPVGFLPPRDSGVLPGDVPYEDNQLSPKLGLSIQGTPTTVIRATAYSRLNPAIGRLQTLEPTQVAGFNQFFDDPAGTSSDNYGVGLDQQFAKGFFGGLGVLRRDLEIPEPTCENPDPTIGCGFAQPSSQIVERTSDDWLGNVYLNATAGRRVALSLEYAYEQREFDFTQVDNLSRFEDSMRTHRVRPQVRYFLPMGFFAGVQATYYDQTVDQFTDLSSDVRTANENDFWIGDVELGYLFPQRWGSVSLRVFNVTDQDFDYYRSSLEESVIPARTVLLSLSFTSP
ncbi:MAG TPA: hypothetical protein VD788_11385, partial [Candidatus Polarisedimenticolaceae bacterium]|nr:hypothetical protein [Candidatus Polarisedimenticolaceae bacterium]